MTHSEDLPPPHLNVWNYTVQSNKWSPGKWLTQHCSGEKTPPNLHITFRQVLLSMMVYRRSQGCNCHCDSEGRHSLGYVRVASPNLLQETIVETENKTETISSTAEWPRTTFALLRAVPNMEYLWNSVFSLSLGITMSVFFAVKINTSMGSTCLKRTNKYTCVALLTFLHMLVFRHSTWLSCRKAACIS